MDLKKKYKFLFQKLVKNIPIYILVLASHYICIYFTRPYYLASQIGWLDPWTSVGFGQVFPQTPYPWHYYKESRFFSIVYQWILTHAGAHTYLFLQTFIVSICGTLVFFYFRKIIKNILLSFILSLPITISSLLWGDSAGGADYYNTLGNCLIVLAFILVFKFQTRRDWNSQPRGLSLLIGCLSYIILIEVPSGIVVVFGFQLSLVLWLWQNSNGKLIYFLRCFKDFLFIQLIGSGLLLLFESFVLLLFKQSPLRLMSGPKFLFDSIVNSDTQKNWWRALNLVDFLKTDYLTAFAGLGVLSILITVVLLSYHARKQKSKYEQLEVRFLLNGFSAFSVTWVILLCLQITRKSVALSLGYFTTPFIFTGFLLVLSFLVYTILISSNFHAILSWPPVILSSVLLTTFLISPIHPSINRSYNFLDCEKARLEFRAAALDLATKLDSTYGPRGTLLMGAEDSIFKMNLNSNCSSLNGRPISEALMSFSQLGFPGVSILGKPAVGNIYDDYPRQYLAKPFGREVAPKSCVLVWRPSPKNEPVNAFYLKFGGQVLLVEKRCP